MASPNRSLVALSLLSLLALAAACNKTDPPKPREDEAKKATPVPSDMVFNDFLPENMKIRGDAGQLPSGLPTGEVVPESDGEKTKVTEAGADPKTARKYTFTAGKTAKRTFTLKGSLDQGGQLKEQPGITVSFDLATKTVKSGVGSMELKVTDVQLADKDKMDKSQAAGFAAQFAGGIGVVMSFDVDPHGKFGEVSVAAPDKKPKQGAAETVQLVQSLLSVLYPLLPEDPIGVGAKWEAGSDMGGGKVTQVFTLKDFDKDNGTIESKIEQHAPPRQMNDPRAPKGTTMKTDMTATTTYSFRLDTPPTKVRNETNEQELITVPAGEGQKPQSQSVSLKKQLSVDTAK